MSSAPPSWLEPWQRLLSTAHAAQALLLAGRAGAALARAWAQAPPAAPLANGTPAPLPATGLAPAPIFVWSPAGENRQGGRETKMATANEVDQAREAVVSSTTYRAGFRVVRVNGGRNAC
jgi:hypothetical protein